MTEPTHRRDFVAALGLGLVRGRLVTQSGDVATARTYETAGALGDSVIEEFVLDIRRFGAVGDGKTDDTPALRLAIAEAERLAVQGVSSTIFVPDGLQCQLSESLVLGPRVSLVLRTGAALIASARMLAVVQVGTDNLSRGCRIGGGGTIDARGLADHALFVRYAVGLSIEHIDAINALGASVCVGDDGAPAHCYEVTLHGVRSSRTRGDLRPARSIGFLLRRCTDSTLFGCTAIGSAVGFWTVKSGNRHIGCNAWSAPEQHGWMETCFIDEGTGNLLLGCTADTPGCSAEGLHLGRRPIGFDLRGRGTQLHSSKVYNNDIYGLDNVVVAVRVGNTTTAPSIVGPVFYGQTERRRLRAGVLIDGERSYELELVAPVRIHCNTLIEES